MEIYCVKEVEQNPVPKSQTKPFYIGTKEAPSVYFDNAYVIKITHQIKVLVAVIDFRRY